MLTETLPECHDCGKKAVLVKLTAEDIQRSRPASISMVCAECREKLRAAARLETAYSTPIALRDLGLIVIVAFSLLILVSKLISDLSASLPLGASRITFLVTAATSFTGLRMAYSEVGYRYGFTHSLVWSLHSRYAMVSISLILSGILAAVVRIFFV